MHVYGRDAIVIKARSIDQCPCRTSNLAQINQLLEEELGTLRLSRPTFSSYDNTLTLLLVKHGVVGLIRHAEDVRTQIGSTRSSILELILEKHIGTDTVEKFRPKGEMK
jgi:hypothetical protein